MKKLEKCINIHHQKSTYSLKWGINLMNKKILFLLFIIVSMLSISAAYASDNQPTALLVLKSIQQM